MFSSGQQDAFASYEKGENIFISGYAGTGKSYLINQIYKHAKENHKNIQDFLGRIPSLHQLFYLSNH